MKYRYSNGRYARILSRSPPSGNPKGQAGRSLHRRGHPAIYGAARFGRRALYTHASRFNSGRLHALNPCD